MSGRGSWAPWGMGAAGGGDGIGVAEVEMKRSGSHHAGRYRMLVLY